MNCKELYVAFLTILTKEIRRFLRIWPQTFLPNIITTTLYFLIFGKVIGSKINFIEGHAYTNYIMPGLVMMSIINGSYNNTVSSFFSTKFQKNIEEIIISPTPKWLIIIGYVTGGMLRGVISGIIVLLLSLMFVSNPEIKSFGAFMAIAVISAAIFANIGLINGLYARNFDDISWVPSFILTPLNYLAGIFYSINQLPIFWQKVSLLNPILYSVDAMRFSIIGSGNMNIKLTIFISILILAAAYILSLRTMHLKLSK